MPAVILAVSGHPERRDGLVAAARRLGDLTGNGRVRVLALPPAPATGIPGVPADVLPVDVLPIGADVAAEVETRGSRADVVVVAQPGPEDTRTIRHAFEAALFKTERPVLMVPSDGPPDVFGRRVAIAWRDDARTLKALVPALRLFAGAEQVHLVAGVPAGAATPVMPAVLVEHGVSATLHVLATGPEPFGQILLGRVRELNADLLIMGAFAHGPLLDMLFGGTTRHILAHADLPVLMRY